LAAAGVRQFLPPRRQRHDPPQHLDGRLATTSNSNQITGASFLGSVGLDWQFAGVAPVHAAGASDLVLRNVNSGALQVYNIALNSLMGSASLGAAGLDWQVGGFAPSSPTGSPGDSGDSTSQLVQAGRFWRGRRRSRWHEFRLRHRSVAAAVPDDAAARMRADEAVAARTFSRCVRLAPAAPAISTRRLK
jgi:hypothetical protein